MHRLDLLVQRSKTNTMVQCNVCDQLATVVPSGSIEVCPAGCSCFLSHPSLSGSLPLQDVVIQCRCMLPDISTQHTLFVGESAFSLSSSESQRIFTRSKWLFLIIYFSSCLKVIVCACEKESSLSMQSIANPTLYCQQMFSGLKMLYSDLSRIRFRFVNNKNNSAFCNLTQF